MARPCRRSRSTAVVLALVVTAPACSQRPGERVAAPAASVVGSAPPATPPRIAPPDEPERKSAVVIVVKDRDGNGRSDIPLRYRNLDGGRPVHVFSGPRGVTRLSLATGVYRVEALAGCSKRTEVFRTAGSGNLGVMAGGPVPRLTLVVDARRRYWAGSPVTWQPEVPWPSGETVTFRFSIYDRCRDRLAPNTTFDDLVYRLTNLRLERAEPRRSDDEAYATVLFRCVKPGDAKLILADPENPDDSVDMIALRPSLDPSAKRCG